MTETKSDQSVVDRYLEIMDNVTNECLETAVKKLDSTFTDIINSKINEVTNVTNIALGINQKGVVLDASAIRKAALETSEPAKKTPAAIEKAGPTGNIQKHPIDQIFDEAIK